MKIKVKNAIEKALSENKHLYEKIVDFGAVTVTHYVDDVAPPADYEPVSKSCPCGSCDWIVITKQKENSDWMHLCYCGECSRFGFSLPFKLSVEQMDEFEMPFGKHKGVPLKEVPNDYLNWLVEKSTVNEKFKIKIKTYLEAKLPRP